MKTDPLRVGIGKLTRAECMQAARDALSCLQNLAEVSSLAEVGAQILARLISKVDSSPPLAEVYGKQTGVADVGMQASEVWSCDQMREYAVKGSQGDFSFDNSGFYAEVGPSWEEALQGIVGLEAGHP